MMTPIQYPQSQWNPPGAGDVSQLMMANAGSSAYQPTWGYGDVLGHYLNTNAVLPEGYTRKQYNEERAMAANEMMLSPGLGIAEFGVGALGTHLAFTVLPSLPGVEHINSAFSGAANYIGRGAGFVGGHALGGLGQIATRHTGFVIDTISKNLFGRATGLDWAAYARAGHGLIAAGATALGGLGLGLAASFFSPSAMVGMEVMGKTSGYVSSIWDSYKLDNDIQREMIAKSDRILRFGAANSSMGIYGGMANYQRDRIVNTISDMAEDYASRHDYFGGGKWSIAGGRESYVERMKELKSMLSVGTDMGMFDMSRSMDDFERKFKETVKTVERLSKFIQKSKGEIMAVIGSIQQNEGIYNMGSIINNITHKNFTAAATGVDLSTVMMEGQAGVQLGRQFGFNSEFGSRVMADSRLLLGRALRAGDLSREELNRLGGEQHAITSLAMARMKMFQDQSVMSELAMGVYYDENGNKHFDRSRLRAAETGDTEVLLDQIQSRTKFNNGFSRNWRQGGRIMRGGAMQAAIPDVQEMIQNGEISQADLYSVITSQIKARHAYFNPGASSMSQDAIMKEASLMFGDDPMIRTILQKGLGGGYRDMEFDEKMAAARAMRRKILDERITLMEDFEAGILSAIPIAWNFMTGNKEGIQSKQDYLRRMKGKSYHAIDLYYKGYSDMSLDNERFSFTAEDLRYSIKNEDKGISTRFGGDIADVRYWINKGSMDAATGKDSGLQKIMSKASRANYIEENTADALVNTKFMGNLLAGTDYAKYEKAMNQMYEAAHGKPVELETEEEVQNYSYVLGQVMDRASQTKNGTEFIRKVTTNATHLGNSIKDLQAGSVSDLTDDKDRAMSKTYKGMGLGNFWKAGVSTLAWTVGGAAVGGLLAAGGSALVSGLGNVSALFKDGGAAALRLGGSMLGDPRYRLGAGLAEAVTLSEAMKAGAWWKGAALSFKPNPVAVKVGSIVGGVAGFAIGVYRNAEEFKRSLALDSALNANDAFDAATLEIKKQNDMGLSFRMGKNIDLFDGSAGEVEGYDYDEIDDLYKFLQDDNNGLSEKDRATLVSALTHVSTYGQEGMDYDLRDRALQIANTIGSETDYIKTRSMIKDILRRDDITKGGRATAGTLAKLFKRTGKGTEKLRANAQTAMFNSAKALKEKTDKTAEESEFLDWYEGAGKQFGFDKYYYASRADAYRMFTGMLSSYQGTDDQKRNWMRRMGFETRESMDLFLNDDVSLDDIYKNAGNYGLKQEDILGMSKEQIKEEIHLRAFTNKIAEANKEGATSDVATTTPSKDGKGGEKMTAEAMERFYHGCLILDRITVKLMGL